ncbi:Neutral/alkaline non-lysosomal ceramidase, N-terminal [Paraburkholderia fungorum]|uniref:Neutral/alkaline non-lysosomal ceramidase, N-terminal n=1 Tax=Paraburkholderia fungorum TaxID=134537 RepID=A0A1H1IPU8_9BURK|nr:neutral/alkaline non-lysosomal ceramidase N-terminal domain-containing protein [Paraburkholderia fungorum]SDR39639.1 Neutral/alkaline non-lysosomal ceramidase, N-terminal [Paraburkholderia fungorum]
MTLLRRYKNLLLVTVALAFASACEGAVAASLRAGAGRAAIEIGQADLPVDGYVSVHDPLQSRVIVLDNGTNRIALVTVDLTSMPDTLVAQVKDIVGRAAQMRAADVVVSASHTFSVPHVQGPAPDPAEQRRKQQIVQAIETSVTQAATIAMQDMQPASIGFGSGTSNVNVNRDVRTADGWWLGANDAGFSDKSVNVIRLEGSDRHPIAIVVNYAVQSSIMNESTLQGGGMQISADLAGAATRYVEQQYGDGTVALFLVGAAGDQAPYLTAKRNRLDRDGHSSTVDIHEAGFLLVDLLGERLGGEAYRVAQNIADDNTNAPVLAVTSGKVRVQSQAFSPNAASKRPSTTYRFEAGKPVDVPFWIVRLGAIAVFGFQAELSSQTAVDMKAHSPFAHTLVATMVNGAAKYLPDAGSYDRITYEAMSAPYFKGSAEEVRDAVIESAGRLLNAR